MTNQQSNLARAVAVGVLIALISAGVLAFANVQGEVSVHAATILQHEKRLDLSEQDQRLIRDCITELKIDQREILTILKRLEAERGKTP